MSGSARLSWSILRRKAAGESYVLGHPCTTLRSFVRRQPFHQPLHRASASCHPEAVQLVSDSLIPQVGSSQRVNPHKKALRDAPRSASPGHVDSFLGGSHLTPSQFRQIIPVSAQVMSITSRSSVDGGSCRDAATIACNTGWTPSRPSATPGVPWRPVAMPSTASPCGKSRRRGAGVT